MTMKKIESKVCIIDPDVLLLAAWAAAAAEAPLGVLSVCRWTI
jgi:hypothetical protein